jgi:hypothetical protein
VWIVVGVIGALVVVACVVAVVVFRRRARPVEGAGSADGKPVAEADLKAVQVVGTAVSVEARGPRKRALLVGCGYTSNASAVAKNAILQATQQDVHVLSEVLTHKPINYQHDNMRCG